MKKIRTMLAFILALSICASMAACGSSGDSGVKSESKSVTTDEKPMIQRQALKQTKQQRLPRQKKQNSPPQSRLRKMKKTKKIRLL